MNRNNRLGFGSNGGFDLSRIQVQSIALAVYKYRIGLEVEHDFRCRSESHCRQDHLVTLFDPYCVQSQVESSCSRINGDRMPATQIPRKVLLKAFDFWTCGEPTGFECLDH